jgi:hypothetical protein
MNPNPPAQDDGADDMGPSWVWAPDEDDTDTEPSGEDQ